MAKMIAKPNAIATTNYTIDELGPSEEDMKAQTSGGGGVSFMKLLQPMSGETGDDNKVGDFFISGGANLGSVVVTVPVASRCRATLWNRDTSSVEKESYDASSPEYSEIRNKGGDYGAEFLFWIPSQSTFAIFGFTKKTSREKAAVVENARKARDVITLTSTVKPLKKGKTALVTATRSVSDGSLPPPEPEAFNAAVAMFQAFKKEKAAAPPATARPR